MTRLVLALSGVALAGVVAWTAFGRGTERPGAGDRGAAGTEEAEDADVSAGGRAARPMAGPGYLPEGAPRSAPPAPAPKRGATPVDFDLLSYFDYDPEADVIPEGVRRLDGTLVEVRGVMYYGIDDPDDVRDFYLMPNHMVCCYGTPRLNEAVEVRLAEGTRTQYVLNYYLVRGTLEVGAIRDDRDRVICLYRIAEAEVEVLE